MKKIIYTVALFAAASLAANAQTPIKETREEVADVTMLGDGLMIYTKKEQGGQFLYTEQRNAPGTARKEDALNAGIVNTVVGGNASTGEVYVYHVKGRKDETIAFYTFQNGTFTKAGERRLPKFRNNSYNLGLYLAPDKDMLLLSGELGRTKGYDDIYLSKWVGEKWTKPKNLGKQVNTRQAEFAPFLSGDSLYFSRRDGAAAYVYAVPFADGGAAAQEPVKLRGSVNQSNAFNAYYKKQGEQELWITASNDGAYTAYATAPEEETEQSIAQTAAPATPAAEPQPPVAAEQPEERKEAVRAADLALSYGFNSLYLSKAGTGKLHAFLKRQPSGAAVHITGFSDGKGDEASKADVSRRRAAFIAWYIKKNFAGKNFSITQDHAVLPEAGAAYRRAEIRVN